MIDKNMNWERFLIRDQFFKLYLENLNISESFNMKRFTDLNEFSKDNSLVHFAIFRYEINPEIDPQYDFDQRRRKKKEVKNENNKLILMYPEDHTKQDDSINFLSLAFSGMANVNEKQQNLFKKSDEENILKNLFENFQEKNPNEIKKNQNIINQRYLMMKSNNELLTKHNSIVKKTLGSQIKKIPPINRDNNFHYSLFYYKDTTLYEFTSHDSMMREVKLNLTNNGVRSVILEEILKTGSKSYIKYLNDVTIFSENLIQSIEKTNLNTEGTVVIMIISLIFIVSFFITNPEKYLWEFKKTSQILFDLYNNSTDFTQNVKSINDSIDYFINNVFPNLYNDNTYYKNQTIRMNNLSTSKKISTSISNNIQFNPKKYYPLNMNVLSGVLISFKVLNGTLKDSYFHRNGTFQFYEPSFNEISSAFSLFSYDNTTNPLIGSCFNLYLKPYLKSNKLNYFKDLIRDVKDDSLSLFSYTIMLYNANFGHAQIYSVIYENGLMNEIKVTKRNHSFNPFIIQNGKTAFLLYTMNFFYIFGFIFVSFIVGRNFSHHIIDLIKLKKYLFEWVDWIDLIVLCFSFTSQVMFYKLILFNFELFPIQIGNPYLFSQWVSHSQDILNYNRITGLAILFIMIRLIRILYTSFPNFGIVFETMAFASRQIFAFIIMLICMMFGITMLSYLNFSWYSTNFLYLGDSIGNIFMMLTGNMDFPTISNRNNESKIVPYFYTFFMFFYNLILINVFLLIIRNHYTDVKEKDQKYNEAYALILTDKSIEFQKNLFNFLICGDPIVENEKKINNNELNQEEKKNGQEIEIVKKQSSSKISILIRMKINFESLKIWQLLFGGNLFSREEFEKNKKDKYMEIDQKQLTLSIQELEIDYENEFDLLSEFAIYVVYIFVLISMIIIQIQISVSNNFILSVDNLIKKELADFSSILKYNNINENLNQFIINSYGVDPTNLNKNATLNPKKYKELIFLQPPYFRLTIRLLNFVENQKFYENFSFPYNFIQDNAALDLNNCGSDIEYTSTFINNQTDYKYTPKSLGGLDSTPDSCGGFVYLFNTSNPYNNPNPYLNFNTYFNYLNTNAIGSIVLDFVLINNFYKSFIYVKYSITRSSIGVVYYKQVINSVPISYYNHSKDLSRFVIEMIYLLFFSYYSYNLISLIFNYIKKYIKKDLNRDPDQEKFKNSFFLNKFFRIDLKSRENDNLVTVLSYFLFKIMERILKFIFILIRSIIKYLKKDVNNIVEFISFSLSLQSISLWIDIILTIYKINTDFIVQDLPVDPVRKLNSYLIADVELLYKKFSLYSTYMSFNIFLITIKAIRFFRFSKSIYNFIKLFDIAKYTILFHIIFLSIIYFGFAIWGFALFGEQIFEFSTLNNTIIELWNVLGGDANLMNYISADPMWAMVYIISFIFFISLILFNILYAIIIETYREIKYNQEQNYADVNFKNILQNILIIIMHKYNIFIKTSDQYYQILVKINDTKIKKILNELEEALDIEKSQKRYKSQKYWKNFISVMRDFTKMIEEKTYQTEKIALRKLPEECYKDDLSYEEMEKKIMEFKILKKNEDSIINKEKEKLITNNKEISIFVKIFAYIINLIQQEQKEYNIRKGKDANFNKFVIDDFLIYMEDGESIESKNLKFAQKFDKKTDKIQSVNKFEKQQEVIGEEDTNKYHFELKKHYQCSFQKWSPFLLKNLMEKEKKLGFNKNATTKLTSSKDSHHKYFYFNKPKIEKMYNLDIILTCNKHSDQKKYDFSCKQCLDHFYYFYNTYIIVYDLLVKYLYLPYKLSGIEKEHYIAFYVDKFQCLENLSKINNSIIFAFKIEELKSNLQGIYDKEKIDISFDFFNCLEKSSSQKKKNDPNDKFSLKKLCSKFVVWNTVYLILLKKFPHFTRELKKNSLTNELINKYKQKLGKDAFFEKFFLEINNISNDDNKMNKNKIKIGELNHKLRNYLTKYNLKIENFSFYNKSFYEVDDKFLIDNENNINIIEETIPHFVYFKTKVPYIKDEFRLLMDLWNSFDKNTDQFYIFFGYNKTLEIMKNAEHFEIFFKKRLSDLNDKEINIHKFFNHNHRAEILKNIQFSDYFVKKLIRKIIEFSEKNNLNDRDKLLKVKTFEDVLQYMFDIKVNYIKYFDLIMGNLNLNIVIFDKEYNSTKKLIKTIDDKYKLVFKVIKSDLKFDNKYKFIEFFKLFISREKFIMLKKLHEGSIKNEKEENLEDSSFIDDKMNPDKIIDQIDHQLNIKKNVELDENNQIKKNNNQEKLIKKDEINFNENIIYAFSLDPYDLVDVLRNIEDDNLREFYMLLMIYMFEDMDFSELISYLERKAQYTLVKKYKYYSMFLSEKDTVGKYIKNYNKEKDTFFQISNYIKYLKEKTDSLTHSREGALRKLLNDVKTQKKENEN